MAHGSLSCIDHILCPASFRRNLGDCWVIEDDPLNLSDHLPIVAKITIYPQVARPADPHLSNSSNWKKCSPEQLKAYQVLSMQSLPTIPQHWDRSTIDLIVDGVSQSLLSAASNSLPPIRFRKHVRPGWSSALQVAHAECKKAYRLLRSKGRSSASSDRFCVQYKEAKRLFRRTFRKYRRHEFDRFLNGLQLDDRRLFHQLRLWSGSSPLPTSSITFDGQSYSDDILEGWARSPGHSNSLE